MSPAHGFFPVDLTAALCPVAFLPRHIRGQPLLNFSQIIINAPTKRAGAGSVMEALALEKPLVVVVNAALMDDHQQELARAMEEQVRAYMPCVRAHFIRPMHPID